MFDEPSASGLLKSEADNTIADHFWREMSEWNDLSYHRPVTFLVNVYLISSFLYYHLNESILSDHDYDRLCKTLLDRYGEIQSHPRLWHRRLISQSALSSGTGFSLRAADYPALLADVANELYRRKGSPPDDDPFVRRTVKLKMQIATPVPPPPAAAPLPGQLSLF